MKTMTYFLLPTCPYCREADRYIAQVIAEEPELGDIHIKRVNEQQEAAYADAFDYYYVPAFYLQGKKLHEGTVTKEQVLAALREVYQS